MNGSILMFVSININSSIITEAWNVCVKQSFYYIGWRHKLAAVYGYCYHQTQTKTEIKFVLAWKKQKHKPKLKLCLCYHETLLRITFIFVFIRYVVEAQLQINIEIVLCSNIITYYIYICVYWIYCWSTIINDRWDYAM